MLRCINYETCARFFFAPFGQQIEHGPGPRNLWARLHVFQPLFGAALLFFFAGMKRLTQAAG
jgi:hypothetical protein